MLKRTGPRQNELEFVDIETLVPKDHLLRKVEHLYCSENGCPAVDGVMLFKMLLLGYLFDIRSVQRHEQEVKVNLAYHWFLGLGVAGMVPDHSAISRNRVDRFAGTDLYQEIFDAIVLQAMGRKLVDGKTIFTDSTHLKANANKGKFVKRQVSTSGKSYTAELDADNVHDSPSAPWANRACSRNATSSTTSTTTAIPALKGRSLKTRPPTAKGKPIQIRSRDLLELPAASPTPRSCKSSKKSIFDLGNLQKRYYSPGATRSKVIHSSVVRVRNPSSRTFIA
ncbi:transposase [Pelagicoccus mobilis]|uniref:Transposase n=1 Tax=Pelagicoccus mobilis TaxID=415221 RepID=A0A934VP38_9BACT|nr:transposase [Pelagicoccus mobilis]